MRTSFAVKEQAVYAYFARHPDAELSERELCAVLGFALGRLYRLLVRLEMRGHLEGRWTSTQGKFIYRMRRYRLTAAGWEKASAEVAAGWQDNTLPVGDSAG